MTTSRPAQPSSPGSRGSASHMPVIAEDDNSSASVPARRGPIPRIPLRVPQKSYRRSTHRSHQPTPFVPDPHPLSEKATEGGSSASTTISDTERNEELLRKLDLHEQYDDFNNHRRRWFRLLLIVGIVVVVVLALAVGLGVGLTNRGSSNDGDDAQPPDSDRFPAGSFTFKTTLQTTTTSCTSDSATWRCYPYETGKSAKFFWVIGSPDEDNSNFTVSSTDDPFALSFTNVSVSLLDAGDSTERLVFSFDTDRTVIPSDKLGPNNRAAKCTFNDTKFEATLWTRRRDNETLDLPDSAMSKFSDWPGDIQVRQIKESELGTPKCEDADGGEIADVQAGSGDCECGYDNFDLDA